MMAASLQPPGLEPPSQAALGCLTFNVCCFKKKKKVLLSLGRLTACWERGRLVEYTKGIKEEASSSGLRLGRESQGRWHTFWSLKNEWGSERTKEEAEERHSREREHPVRRHRGMRAHCRDNRQLMWLERRGKFKKRHVGKACSRMVGLWKESGLYSMGSGGLLRMPGKSAGTFSRLFVVFPECSLCYL